MEESSYRVVNTFSNDRIIFLPRLKVETAFARVSDLLMQLAISVHDKMLRKTPHSFKALF